MFWAATTTKGFRYSATNGPAFHRQFESTNLSSFRDLEELWTMVKDSIQDSDIPAWLRSESDAFAGRRPIELLKDGKARDIIVEFRRLQAGEPA